MKTLYRQFIVTTLLVILFSSVVGLLLTNTYYALVTKVENNAKNVAIATEIVHYIETSKPNDLERYLKTIGDVGYHLYVVNESSYSQFFGGEFRVKQLPESVIRSVLAGEIYHGMENFPKQSFMTGYFANELQNTVGVPFQYEGERYGLFLRPNIGLLFSEVHTILAGFIVSLVVIILIAMLFVAKQLIRPITQLTEATKLISRGKYDLLLSIHRRDEIGQLATSFNEMTKQLQENDRSRKEFINNVSHDFQSPLLNIKGYAQLLKSANISEEERMNYTSIIEMETKRLSNLTKQLLLLTSLDQATRRLNRSMFSLDQLIKSLSQKYLWLIEERGIELYYKTTPIQFYGDESLLEIALENLLINALKYNKENGSIQMSIKEFEQSVSIEIQDRGIGLKKDEIPHVFERFYRADSSRSRVGTGLGLAIVKQIIEMHEGTIHVTSEFGEGTSFFIVLPKV